MRKIFAILAVLALTSQHASTQALDLTVDDKTVNAGAQSIALNVVWSSTTVLDFLSTEFIITAVGSSPANEAVFSTTSGSPPVPPLSNSSYVFFGNSSDLTVAPSVNPASVYQTTWNNDTYNFADSTADGLNQTQDGTRLWTILNIDLTALAAGSYQINLGSSSYTNAANTEGLTPTFTGGLITINSVPEPSTYALGMITFGVMAVVARQRKNQAGPAETC